MWYSRIIESATAWDVLSTKEVSWAGSFSRTFKDFSFYDPNDNPTMTAMLKFIGDIEKGRTGDSIIDRYLEQARSDHNALSDISIFSYNLSTKRSINDVQFYNIKAKIESSGNILSLIAKQKKEGLTL